MRNTILAGSKSSRRLGDEFAARLKLENRTLKRALTDPRLFSGIGNAYSDEILHEARLSPTQLTSNLTDRQTELVFESVKVVLRTWAARLIEETGDRFPEKVTAFRAGMAVHGKFGQPCPRCGAPVQRIQYAANECNYCAPCQTGGTAARRPGAVAAAWKGLAAIAGGTRRAETTMRTHHRPLAFDAAIPSKHVTSRSVISSGPPASWRSPHKCPRNSCTYGTYRGPYRRPTHARHLHDVWRHEDPSATSHKRPNSPSQGPWRAYGQISTDKKSVVIGWRSRCVWMGQ